MELGTEKVGTLLKRYAMPAIIAQTATSLYNMVDSIFIGQGCGALAISGLAVTFPLMNLSIAFGTLVGIGGSTLISVLLGQKNYQAAQKVLGNLFLLNILIGALFSVVSLSFLNPILRFFGASDATLPYAREYLIPILWGNIITHLYFGFNGIVRVSGHPKRAMYATLLTVSLNTLLDPLFIFVFKMGIQGAAIATVLAQCVSLVWLMRILTDKREFLHLTKENFGIDWQIARRSSSIGMSPFLMNVAACFVVIFINNQLKRYGGDLHIGAYGIVNRLVFIFFMVIMGLNQGMQPIAGYNYGAGKMDRLKEVYKLSMKWNVLVGCVGTLLVLTIPRYLAMCFTKENELIELCIPVFRLMLVMAPFIGFTITNSQFFQSIDKPWIAIVTSLSRQVLFLVPLIYVVPSIFESFGWDSLMGVFTSCTISDVLGAILAAILLWSQSKIFKPGYVPEERRPRKEAGPSKQEVVDE